MLEQRATFLRRHAVAAIASAKSVLGGLARSALFREPLQRVQQAAQRLDTADQTLTRAATAQMSDLRQRVASAEAGLRHHRPDQQLALLRQRLSAISARLAERASRQIQRHRERTGRIAEMLRLLSPKSTLKRGYSLTTNPAGVLLRSVTDVAEGATVLTEFADGKVESVVQRIRKAKRGK
jgi:exodeoxyribonuclease VII large subunit